MEALFSCVAFDYTFSGIPDSDDYALVSEQVSHVIEKEFCGQKVTLCFESTGEMTYCTGFWSEYLRQVWGAKWPLGLLKKTSGLLDELFSMLDASVQGASPETYPSDKGEFLGSLSYALKAINAININGPEYAYSNGEDQWDGLSEEYSQRFPGTRNDRDGQMCWLHYVDAEQAATLGISAADNDAIGANPDYPAWVPKTASGKDLEATWISPDDLQKIYSGGKLLIQKSTDACLAFGCGAEWETDHLSEDDELSDDFIFNPLTAPLIEITVRWGDQTLPDQLMVLKPYLIKFYGMIAS